MNYSYELHRAQDLLFVIETDLESGEKMHVSIGSFDFIELFEDEKCTVRCQRWLKENYPELLL